MAQVIPLSGFQQKQAPKAVAERTGEMEPRHVVCKATVTAGSRLMPRTGRKRISAAAAARAGTCRASIMASLPASQRLAMRPSGQVRIGRGPSSSWGRR